MENTPLRFDVTFEAGPKPSVKWYLDGEEIESDDDIEVVVEKNHSVLIIKVSHFHNRYSFIYIQILFKA